MFERFRSLDAFPETKESHRVRTISGGSISLVALVAIFILFFSEFASYLTTSVTDRLVVEGDRDQQITINFDFTFPKLRCSVVNVDAVDVSGHRQEGIDHHVYKKRLDPNGKQIGFQERHELGATIKTREELFEHVQKNETKDEDGGGSNKAAASDAEKCGSCYGAESGDIKCCNTCSEVREAYRKKGWSFSVRENIVQCTKEGFVGTVDSQEGEGCRIYGHIAVPRVAGNFHFSPGTGFKHASVADLFGFTLTKWNVSHIINDLSFGDKFPSATYPLNGVQKFLQEGTGMYQYYAKVVPTEYEYRSGRLLETNQFSVTHHFRRITSANSRGMPGVFIFYDLSPIKVHMSETAMSFSTFLTSVCAIIGGVFTVMRLLDAAMYGAVAARSGGKIGILGA